MGERHPVDGEGGAEGAAGQRRNHHLHSGQRVVVDHPGVVVPGGREGRGQEEAPEDVGGGLGDIPHDAH